MNAPARVGQRRFESSRHIRASAHEVFALAADVRQHSRWIPLTRGSFPLGPNGDFPPGPLPVGTHFTMRSWPGIVDRMVITQISGVGDTAATKRIILRKAGPVLLGSAGIDVTPVAASECVVTWWENVHLAGPLPTRLTRALTGPVLARMVAHALRKLSREVESPSR